MIMMMTANFLECLVVNTLHILTHLVLTTTLQIRNYYYYPHFRDGTEAQRDEGTCQRSWE